MRQQMTRAERHHHILRTAKKLFLTEGYDNITIADVIHASNIARGTFYLHFSSLEALLIALFDAVVEETWQRIAPILESVDDVEQATEQIVHTVLDMFGEDEAPLAEIFFSGGGSAFLKWKEDALYGKLGRLIHNALAQRHRIPTDGTAPEENRRLKWTVHMLITLVSNMSHYSVRYVDPDPVVRRDFERQLVQFVYAGLTAQLPSG